MCPRATAQQGGAAMARASAAASVGASCVHSFVEEEYIDLDLSSCGEFEFRVRRSNADELLCRGSAAAPSKAGTKSGGKMQEVDAAAGSGCGGGGRRTAPTVAPLQHSHSAGFRDAHAQPAARARAEGSKRRNAARTVQAKLQASRAFFRSLFARTSCSDERCHGAFVRASTTKATPFSETKQGSCKAPFGEDKNGYGSRRSAPTTLRSSIEQEMLMDEEELAATATRQRKSFSGVIRWRHATTPHPPAPAPAKPLSSSSARRSTGACGVGVGQGLKKSNSARSESEGLIQGAIAYCKRSQQQLGLARKSVSDGAGPSWPPCGNYSARSAPAYCYYY